MKERSRFSKARDGNVTMMFALGAPVLIFGIAIAIDFTNATVVHSKLNAAADVAGLAALTPSMMQQTDSVAKAAAVAMFTARANAISSLVSGQTVINVVITHPGSLNTRRVAVTYTAQTNTILGGVLGKTALGVGGSSTSQATTPPNIDFYLLLDNSPSMALPATTDGITAMQNATPNQGGCAFACHQASTNNGDSAGNPCADTASPPNYSAPTASSGNYCAAKTAKGVALTQIDNYALARKNNIQLRLDELSTGITALMTTASGYHNSGIYATPPIYRFAAYSMDSLWQIGTTNTQLMGLTTNYNNSWTTAAANFGVMEMYANNITCGNSACTLQGIQGDVATNYDNAMSDMYNNVLPAPGNGTNQPGDKPQEVLFFVTDGVEDEQNINRLIQPINGGAGTNYCTLIKNMGVKIAILYTEYYPVPSNSFYQSNVAPFQANIGPQLQACASPSLYYDAAIGTNTGTALSTLFNIVAQQAALAN